MGEVAWFANADTLLVSPAVPPATALPSALLAATSYAPRRGLTPQESMFTEDLSGLSLSLLPGALLEGNSDIQCCAEELEAQAKLLEDEW